MIHFNPEKIVLIIREILTSLTFSMKYNTRHNTTQHITLQHNPTTTPTIDRFYNSSQMQQKTTQHTEGQPIKQMNTRHINRTHKPAPHIPRTHTHTHTHTIQLSEYQNEEKHIFIISLPTILILFVSLVYFTLLYFHIIRPALFFCPLLSY